MDYWGFSLRQHVGHAEGQYNTHCRGADRHAENGGWITGKHQGQQICIMGRLICILVRQTCRALHHGSANSHHFHQHLHPRGRGRAGGGGGGGGGGGRGRGGGR